MKILWSFTHPLVFPTLYDFFCWTSNKYIFEQCLSSYNISKLLYDVILNNAKKSYMFGMTEWVNDKRILIFFSELSL